MNDPSFCLTPSKQESTVLSEMAAQEKQMMRSGPKSMRLAGFGNYKKAVSELPPPLVEKLPVRYNWLSRKPRKEAERSGWAGIEGGGVVVKRGGELAVDKGRKSVSHVETNLVSVAAFLQVKVLVSDMPGFMQAHAFKCARSTYDSLEKFSSKHMAYNIKKEFDKVYGPAWHCIVGSDFGSFVTHSTGCFLYFCMEKQYVLLFRTKIQKATG